MLIAKLFRGVNSYRFSVDGGLSPKNPGSRFTSQVICGSPHAICGSGVVVGTSVANSVVAHQWNQTGAFPPGTSGVSTTPHFARATFYALHGERFTEGRVVELDVEKLRQLGVAIWSVHDFAWVPAVPEDDENILVASDFGPIPAAAVVQVHKVFAKGAAGR
jgi:hypothetical protein